MKKIIMAVAAIAMAVSMFAAEFSATLNILGNIASGDSDGNYNIIGLNDTSFKSGKDLFGVNFSGDKGGVSIGIGTDDTVKLVNTVPGDYGLNPWDPVPSVNPGGTLGDLNIRSARIWMQPIDMVKITLGDLYDEKLFLEHICWWRTPDHRGSMNAFTGLNIEVTPIEGLRLSASIETGWGGYFVGKNGDYKNWSIFAKYNTGDIVVGVGYKDEGKGKGKVINVGASYGNEWGGPFFGFLSLYVFGDKDYKFDTMAIDNWFKFSVAPITASVRVPVIFDFAGKKFDLDWEAKIDMPVGPVGVYLRLGTTNSIGGTDFDKAASGTPLVGWVGAPWGYYNLKNFVFNMAVAPGVTFNIGVVSMDVCLNLGFAKDAVKWQIPFTAKVTF